MCRGSKRRAFRVTSGRDEVPTTLRQQQRTVAAAGALLGHDKKLQRILRGEGGGELAALGVRGECHFQRACRGLWVAFACGLALATSADGEEAVEGRRQLHRQAFS